MLRSEVTILSMTFVCLCLFRENEVEEVKEEGPKEMTLDEWKAMQDKERSKVEFNIRKPNEGNDGQWKKGYVLHKSKSEEVGTVSFLKCLRLCKWIPVLILFSSWFSTRPSTFHFCMDNDKPLPPFLFLNK